MVLPFQPGFRLIDGSDLNMMLAGNGFLSSPSLTAKAGGGQAGATLLPNFMHRVTTVATANDSVVLPAAQAGEILLVNNSDPTDSLQVFANGSDTINGIAGATGIPLLAGQSLFLFSPVAGVWFTASPAAGSQSLVSRSTTQLDATSNTTLANIAGLVATVTPGSYLVRLHLTGTAGASGGWKTAFKYTGTVLSALTMTGYAYTASAVAVAATTTTTDQASIIAATTAYIGAIIEGSIVVTTGGTIQAQFAQNASNGTPSSIYVGSTMELIRVA